MTDARVQYNTEPKDVVDFWREAGPQRWFTQDRDFDAQLRWLFFGAYLAASRGGLDQWLATAEGSLALILLLDQFPRNAFRGLARSYATDPKALAAARVAIEKAFDQQVEPALRRFIYMPLMHAENLTAQDECLALMRRDGDPSSVRFSEIHRDIIARFGQFPHRNAVLGRQTTQDERDFLAQGGIRRMTVPSNMFQRPEPDATDAVVSLLSQQFGNRVSVNETVQFQHAHTLIWGENQPADAVVFAQSREEVAQVVRLCAEYRVPLIPFGTGTSLEGHVNAPYGGICVDLSMMNRILAVHSQDLDCVIEPGVTRKALNEHLRDSGLFFPIDPGADASLGGMVSTRASGTNAVRYGTMKDNVLALEVVTATGETVRTGRRAKKSSAGYDLTRLFIGAEGTLGVVTGITLRLAGIPEAISAGICPFPSVRAACDATIATIQTGLPVARIELLDALQVRAVNLHSHIGLQETPMLLLEFHGTSRGVEEQAERFGEIAAEFGGGPFTWATRAEDRTRLWQARHDAYWSALALRPGSKAVATDVCVPISRLADCVTETQADIAASGLVAPILGHVGDGNFHVSILVDMADAAEVARVEAFIERLVRRGLAMEGTCTGEHGIGQLKRKYMLEEHAPEALSLMRGIKAAFDPLGIMNPGKIL